jgi:hypothetical protein
MTVLTNVYATYGQGSSGIVGASKLKESLDNVIANISPSETIFLNRFKKGKANARYEEWMLDTLALYTDNAQLEGDAVAGVAVTGASRTGNYTQIVRKSFTISGTNEVVDKAGKRSEIAYQTAKQLKELAKDIEFALSFGTGNSGNIGAGRRMKGVMGTSGGSAQQGWVTTNVYCASACAVPEADFNALLQTIWKAGGKPQSAFVGGYSKRIISAYTGNSTRFTDVDKKEAVNVVDIYKSDFGPIRIFLQRLYETSVAAATAATCAFPILQEDLWEIRTLRPTSIIPLAKTGDGETRMIIWEGTLVSRAEAGNATVCGTRG